MIKTPLYNPTRACEACSLRQGCAGPVPAVGPPNARLMLVGEAPGRREDETGEPFTGDAGRYLNSLLKSIGVSREDIVITNTVKCRPKGNRTPTYTEAQYCASRWLDLEVELLQPEVVVAMGSVAIQHFLGEGTGVEHVHGIPVLTNQDRQTQGGEHVHGIQTTSWSGGRRPGEEAKRTGQGGLESSPYGVSSTPYQGTDGQGDAQIVLPVFHPASGFHDTAKMRFIQEDFQALGRLLRGEKIDRPVDNVPVRYGVDTPVQFNLPVALDSETVDGKLWSVQLSSVPGESLFIPAAGVDDRVAELKEEKDGHNRTGKIQRPAGGARPRDTGGKDPRWSTSETVRTLASPEGASGRHSLPEIEGLSTVVVHNYLFDAQFVALPTETHDTMVMAYNLGLSQGLKELAWRLCGMEMQSYQETIGGKRKEKALAYLEEATKGPPGISTLDLPWPDPPEIVDLSWNKTANKLEEKTRKPQHITRKVKRIIADVVGGKVNKDGSVDPWDRWHNIDERERAVVEEVLGPMPAATLEDVPLQEAVRYSCRDSDATLRVLQSLEKEIASKGLRLAYELDRRTLPIALAMQQNGIKVDGGYLMELGKDYLALLQEKAEEIFEIASKRFNPNSPPQLAQLLYEDLGFKPGKYTPAGMPSTESEELSKLDQEWKKKGRSPRGLSYVPVIPLLKEYKHVAHIKDSFCDTLPGKVDADGRIHTTIKTTRTETGRWSMADPNLQQIPQRTEIGRAVRRGFVAEEGRLLVALDFSQIEMRVIAHLAQCQSMIELFREGRDVHTETAAQVFGVSLAEASDAQYRYPCKTLGFGVLYGLTYHGLANQMAEMGLDNWTEDKCEGFIQDYYELRPEIYRWQEATKAFARENGYVRDLFGRIRYTPEILCPIRRYRSAGERQAINMPVQAGAADILKLAMIKLWRAGIDGEWLLQVHDELVFSVEKEKVEGFIDQVTRVMETAVYLSVPVLVEAKTGENWGEMS